CRSRSPATWPMASLMDLKSSRSKKTTANRGAVLGRRAKASDTRSTKRARLASPVRWSCEARSRSSTSSATRSLASRVLSTMPSTPGSSKRMRTDDSPTRLDQSGQRGGRGTKGHVLEECLPVIGVEPRREVLSEHRFGLHTEDLLHRGALVDDRALPVDDGDDVGRV